MKYENDPAVIRCVNFFMSIVDMKQFVELQTKYIEEGDDGQLRQFITNALVKTVNKQ